MNRQSKQDDVITLMYQVMRQMKRVMGAGHAKLDINPYHLHALFLLAHQPHTAGELADELSVTLPSCTALVNRLVDQQLVERTQDKEDRRIVRLALSKQGKKLLDKAKAERYKRVKFFLDELSDDDLASLHRIFTNLHETLEKKGK